MTARDPNGSPIVSAGRDPVLAVEGSLLVHGGLHNIKGNHAPYFAIGGEIREKRTNRYGRSVHEVVACGTLHDEIGARLPGRFSDLIALHLSDIDGVPMYAEANGWYWLTGALGGLGERYHGGNSNPSRSPAECLVVFAGHVRVSPVRAEEIAARVRQAYDAALEANGPDSFASAPGHTSAEVARKAARKVWAEMVPAFHERWKREARACIERHDLVQFGDGGLVELKEVA